MKNAAPPDGAHLPVEPVRPFPVDALKDAAQRRAGSLSPYQMSSSDFDVAFITPVLTYGAQYQSEQARGRERSRGARTPDAEPAVVRPLMDFSNWSEYVADFPPVLLVRVTPKLVEGFWTTVARGAARTQGVALPPIKHFKSGFSRMRAFCGDAEVTPIHPFKLEQRVAESDAIYEGLYVFDPGALGPQCGTVKLVLYSEKEPEKGDTRVVDPKVLQQIWQDFAPYRDQTAEPNRDGMSTVPPIENCGTLENPVFSWRSYLLLHRVHRGRFPVDFAMHCLRRGAGLLLPAARHFDPVQFLFHLMKGIVADLVAGAHRENGLARRLKCVGGECRVWANRLASPSSGSASTDPRCAVNSCRTASATGDRSCSNLASPARKARSRAAPTS